MSEIIGYKVNGEIIDTQSIGNIDSKEPIYFDNSEESLYIMRHTCAHLMAEAIKILYPEAQFFVGPVVNEGFYYDFRVNHKISEDDLKTIENKMKQLAKKGEKLVKYSLPRDEAIEKFKNDDLKQAVISRIPLGDGTLSIYSQGEFEDLCRGPHLPTLKLLNSFKLTKIAGAYLCGDENSEMLTRIYGIAFADKDSLNTYLRQLEEAKKRDHRKVGMELGLFTFDDEIGAGLPIWLPSGARLRRNIENLLTQALIERGYEPVRGPEILKSDVWRVSGHYANYGENMYFTTIDNVEYGIKPMNCVGHIKVYQSSPRSYRDLPLRFYEYGVVHRHEKSGVLHGLLRVREFTQDDAHIFCLPSQIGSEVKDIIEFTQKIMNAFGFKYEMEISTRPEKSIGSDEVWEEATNALKEALDEYGIDYAVDEGGGAFYGPKIDIKITDAIGRKWQCGTIQIDMNLPERFKLEYTADDNTSKQPIMIHRAILGSFERFVAILTEHFGGEFPFFVAPTQIIIIPISNVHTAYSLKIRNELLKYGVYSEIDSKNDTLNKRIRNAEKQRVPMILVLGDEEVKNNSVAIRDRRNKEHFNMDLVEFIKFSREKMREVSF
ncbi:threonine--tRNA ligase [Helicobacter sp. WB40]|uniref:threonine--tRNA ligase n=1 Tax=Helicobacter sp. WB40 TaxID=3004130 RepID=UPI0022EBE5FE|nr:threonine--tRNA ligase [Helicobacter sp. WB40]MDA3967630.1 threonine--tRNA ligase [Helicobacter sp. WB40]